MQLGWIRSFLSVVDLSGFVNAGLSLRRAQSRVSADVRSLEAEIGAELLDRASRPISLTAAGASFLPFAREIIESYEQALAAVSAAARAGHGVVRIGTIASVATLVLPELLTRFAQAKPGISVDVIEIPPVNLADQLLAGDLEMIVVPQGHVDGEPAISWIPLWREPLVVVLPPNHRLAHADQISLPDLEGETIITPGGGRTSTGNSPEFQRMLDREKISTRANGLVVSPLTLTSMVRLGLCIAVMSELGVELGDGGGITTVRLSGEGAERVTVLASRREAALSRAATDLRAFILSSEYRGGQLTL